MNKKTWLSLAILAIIIAVGIYFYTQNQKTANQENNYEANRTSANSPENSENQENTNSWSEENKNHNDIPEERQGIAEAENSGAPAVTEEQIATFSTKIYSNDGARQNNISITCNTLNGTIVSKGSTFSFCGTVGQSSTSKGYQKADIFDKNGNKKKGLGGRKLSN